MKHFNLKDCIADIQVHLQTIDVTNPNSTVNKSF